MNYSGLPDLPKDEEIKLIKKAISAIIAARAKYEEWQAEHEPPDEAESRGPLGAR